MTLKGREGDDAAVRREPSPACDQLGLLAPGPDAGPDGGGGKAAADEDPTYRWCRRRRGPERRTRPARVGREALDVAVPVGLAAVQRHADQLRPVRTSRTAASD